VAGKIVADIIEAPAGRISLNVANVTVASINASGLYTSTGNLLITQANQIGSAALPAGSVLQVVNSTTSTKVTSTTSTFVDTTLTASITPKFSTSKILVLVHQNGCRKAVGNVAADMKLKLMRNSTDINNIALFSFFTGTSLEIRGQTLSTSYLDSPATTSATTYKTQFAAAENVGEVNVQNEAENSVSTITLMEIAA
jgi:hypothetical protein